MYFVYTYIYIYRRGSEKLSGGSSQLYNSRKGAYKQEMEKMQYEPNEPIDKG